MTEDPQLGLFGHFFKQVLQRQGRAARVVSAEPHHPYGILVEQFLGNEGRAFMRRGDLRFL